MSDAAALGETAAARAAAAAAQEASARAEEAKANLDAQVNKNKALEAQVLENPTPETARAYTDSLTAMMEAGKMYTSSDKAAADAQNAAMEAARRVDTVKQAAADALTQEARAIAWQEAGGSQGNSAWKPRSFLSAVGRKGFDLMNQAALEEPAESRRDIQAPDAKALGSGAETSSPSTDNFTIRQSLASSTSDATESNQDALMSPGKIDIIGMGIDELTPCLRRQADGKLINTSFKKINPSPQDYKGWEFNWFKPHRNGFEVFALHANGDSRAQGMIAMKPDPTNSAVVIDIVEAAPHNSPHNPLNKSGGKEYSGIGGHLFAEACRRSLEMGYGGFVYFKAKTNLVEHYQKTLGAKMVNPSERIMAIDERAAAILIKKYYGGEIE